MTEMYKISLFGLYEDGSEAFRRDKYFTSKVRAIDCARRMTKEDMTAEHNWRDDTIHKCDIYVHVIRFVDSEGRFRIEESGIFSSLLADGARQCFENTKPLFTSL